MRVIISAGGTGGHIYPALAIIQKIKKEDINADILYIGTTDRMEKDIIPTYNIKYYGIKVRGIDRRLSFDNFRTIKYFVNAVKITKRIIRKFKPDIVIGVGGYVTAPVIYAAHKCKVKTLIHEQNSVLGMTNRFLSRYVNAVAISFNDTNVKSNKVVYTGNPSSELNSDAIFDKKEFKLHNDKKLLMIVMGSLGSKVVSDKMKDILPAFNNKSYEVLFVTGKDYYEEFKKLRLNNNIVIVPYIDNLKKVFNKVDLLISRAGATTIGEIKAYKVPTILVPSPYVTDNHQYKNAKSLVDKNCALLIEESNLNKESLISIVDSTINNKIKTNEIRKNLSKINIVNSSDKIYDLIKDIVSGR